MAQEPRRRHDLAEQDAIAAWVPPKNGLREASGTRTSRSGPRDGGSSFSPAPPDRGVPGSLHGPQPQDHTTLSRRNQIVAVPPLTRSHDGPID